MKYVLYNPLASNNTGEEIYNRIKQIISERFPNYIAYDITTYDKEKFFSKVTKDDILIIVGGDGTLNTFINNVKEYKIECEMYYFKGGNGNDFLEDVKERDDQIMVYLNPYMKRLPKVTVNGMTKYFINGIGYGIDGMVCEVADKLRAEGKTDISYSNLSIKLLFKGYKCPNATVSVDGKEYKFEKVWLASAMNGRYYGGGMKIAPEQNRLSSELSLSIIHNSSKLETLMIFPKIFKGTHVNNKKISTILTGKKITVSFDIPTALQIDGETVVDVSSYTVEA